ncbi:MAG: ATP-binding region, ATPase domain protein [Ramlibacter sp.]|jgi:predicted ATPase/signal transduction histidine kinase|nr:ATP-binding region, ATPase domain protein [Ramlibacter sp.]
MISEEPPAADSARQRTRHERRIISQLAGVEGVACLFDKQGDVIGRKSEGEQSLSQVLAGGPLEVSALLELALRLAHTLAAMHHRGVLHHNINPDNIRLNGPHSPPLLIDFRLATTFAEEQPGFTHHREIRGNLTYLAPEQTGRTGRSVDLRADLYALGATLYEAATGRPPFEAQDPLQLLHDRLARLPLAPMQLRADLPVTVSQIILRLLEKEPERRYQSAEGLAHDLVQVQQALARGDTSLQRVGERDFAMQLSAPTRLVSRSSEIGALQRALDEAIKGRCRMVLVSGAPGVGKTSLINELRPMVTAQRGWFVSGKFDQYRHDAPTAPAQAFRALGRLLLAEPEAELAAQRERILRAVGPNASLIINGPEFALLLGPQPEVPPAEPAQAEARLLATAVSLLRAIASPERPLVMVLDDLQWAAALSTSFIETVLDSRDLPGLLLVGAYRDSELDAAHPLTALLSRRYREAHPPVRLSLGNLPAEDLSEMLEEMMRMPKAQAATLAHAVSEHTGGNPYDTAELLNALRRDGVLRPGPGGWEWDTATLRRYVGQSGVLDLLAARIARLPAPSQALMHAMACLGGRMPRSLLAAAIGLSEGEIEEQLVAPLEDGLLVIEPGEDGALRMRHDRVQQAVYASLAQAQRRAIHLGLARRLAAAPEFSTEAVQQYLPAVEDIDEPEEIRNVARRLHQMAIRIKRGANYTVAQRLLAAALSLLSRLPAPSAQDESLSAALEIDHHTVLCVLGRFEEADALYRVIEGRGAPVEDWLDAACAQINSVQNRSRAPEALMLGLSLLGQLGLVVPDDFETAGVEQRLANLGAWIRHTNVGRDARPYSGDRRSNAAARLISVLEYPAYFTNTRVMGWLILEGQKLWNKHGPSPELVHALSAIGGVAIGLNEDYRTAYDSSRHVLGVSEARGWEPATSEARFLFANHASHWFEPLEHTVRQFHLARQGLHRNGELQTMCFSYRPTAVAMLDCSPKLQACVEEIESGLALAFRLRHELGIVILSLERQMLRRLHVGAGVEDDFAQDVYAALQRQVKVQSVSLSFHFVQALVAAVFADTAALAEHAAAAVKYVPSVPTSYRGAQARLLRTFALAQQARTAGPGERSALLAELDARCQWLAARAADAPGNFLHLSSWMEAEQAWAVDDFRRAARAFDMALRQVESLTRPWHHALIAERCGLFHLEQGMSKSGQQFIAHAKHLYQAWGADAKVRQLEAAHGFLTAVSAPASSPADVDTPDAPVDTIDALAILRASQALSSETSLARLQIRVAEVVGALTGATAVRFALRDEDLKDWFFSDGQGTKASRIPAAEAGARGLVPLSAFRYAERTREPLLVEDALADDRFARDPYFAGHGHCSLLVMPILNQGSLRAMLVLENRLSRGAFSTGRLDAVMLIAGQLAVSLENALLYDRLEPRVREQTHELLAAARRSGMAQIATNVLHNVGNVLTSVNVSAHVLEERVRKSRAARVGDLAGLLESNAGDLGGFFADDEKGRRLPGYLRELAQALAGERDELLGELGRLGASVDHIKNVVAMQQSYAGASGVLEVANMTELVDDALRIQEDALAHQGIRVVRGYERVEPVGLDKTRVMQILINLIENARQAMEGVDSERRLSVGVRQDADWLSVSVSDDGCGIAADNLTRVFSHGFTTKPGGHGFGLHSCVLAAKEIGGTLTVQSDGPGTGATFTLQLPKVARAR